MNTINASASCGDSEQDRADLNMEALFLSELDMGRIMDGLFQGMEPATMLGWKPEETENFYALAYRHYVAGDFDGARPIFQILCKLKPNDARFWMGYGACLQGSNSYLEAIDAYSMACVGERFGSPVPFLYVATCFVLLKEKKKAYTVLDALLRMGDANNPTHAASHEKARNMLHMLDV